MYSMNFDITIGKYRLAALEKVAIKCSVENLADTADITLPGTLFNRALKVEQKIAEGDAVRIRLGYDRILRDEFSGYVSEIATDNDSVRIHCEDELYKFRKDLKDRVLKSVTVKTLLTSSPKRSENMKWHAITISRMITSPSMQRRGTTCCARCRSETKANIYLRGKTLHVHPQYAQIGEKVIYDFAVNIEKSDLKYRDASKRKFLAVVEGTDAKGKTIRIERGTTGGDKFTLKLPGVSDRKSLEQRADEELKVRAYTGYEGSFTGWLEPYVEPTWLAEIRDTEYEYKNGSYYVLGRRNDFLRQRCEPGRHHRKTHRKQWITPRR